MYKIFCFFLLILMLAGCRNSEKAVPAGFKEADEFAQLFISDLVKGRVENYKQKVDTLLMPQNEFDSIPIICGFLKGLPVHDVRILDYSYSKTHVSGSPVVYMFQLFYHCQIENHQMVFLITLKKENEKFLIAGFDAKNLLKPLAELNSFNFWGKSIWHYLFFLMAVLIDIFMLLTFILLLLTKMDRKQKILWVVVVLLLAFPTIRLDWNNGQFDFHLFSFHFFGSSLSRPHLYSHWLLSLNLPLGAIFFWYKRKGIMLDYERMHYREDSGRPAANEVSVTENESGENIQPTRESMD